MVVEGRDFSANASSFSATRQTFETNSAVCIEGIKRSKMTEAISKKLDNFLKAIEVLLEKTNNYEDGGKLDNIIKSLKDLNQEWSFLIINSKR